MDKQKRRRLAQIGVDAMDKLDLPETIGGDIPRMEMTGNREFYMDHHRGVLAYSTESVDVNGGSVIVRLTGSELQIVAMTDREVRVVGTIRGLELVE